MKLFSRRDSILETIPETKTLEPIMNDVEDIDWSIWHPFGLEIPTPSFLQQYDDVNFKDLTKRMVSLQKANRTLSKQDRIFHDSKISHAPIEGEDSDDEEDKDEYSMVELAKLVKIVNKTENLIKSWSVKGGYLMTICNNDPDNPRCWGSQRTISKLVRSLPKRIKKIKKHYGIFVDPEGKFIEKQLYLNPEWTTTAIFDGNNERFLISYGADTYPKDVFELVDTKV